MTGYPLPEYWIDTSVFIQAKNGPYGFDIVPGFWAFLDRMSDGGAVSSTTLVYDEMVRDSEDELAEWAKERKGPPMFAEPDETVQEAFADIAQHVVSQYEQNQAAQFLRKADAWLIAHAVAYRGKVATQEVRVNASSKKAKIPNVCDVLGVESVSMYRMMRELGASIG